MKNETTLLYDGSFNGFLTAVYVAFEERLHVVGIEKNEQGQNELFSETETIFTHVEKAKRVWNGVRQKSYNAITNIYFAYLSETKGIELMLYGYIKELMTPKGTTSEFSGETIAFITQLAQKVSREKQRLETSVKLDTTKDGVYFATLAPDFNVLPLLSKHFRTKHSDQEWVLYDVKRKYAVYYHLNQVELVRLTLDEVSRTFGQGNKKAWHTHFKNEAIRSRIQRKVHPQRVPTATYNPMQENRTAV